MYTPTNKYPLKQWLKDNNISPTAAALNEAIDKGILHHVSTGSRETPKQQQVKIYSLGRETYYAWAHVPKAAAAEAAAEAAKAKAAAKTYVYKPIKNFWGF